MHLISDAMRLTRTEAADPGAAGVRCPNAIRKPKPGKYMEHD